MKADTADEARLCAAALDACNPQWCDTYTSVASDFGLLHARHMLHAFDRGALWAIREAAALALKQGFALRDARRQVLRGVHARGSVLAGEHLARSLLISPHDSE